MSISKFKIAFVYASVGLCLSGQSVFANCVTESMGANPYLISQGGELVVPLIQLSGTESDDAEFIATRLQLQANSNPPSFEITEPFSDPGEDCDLISIPVANFDVSTQELSIPNIAVFNNSDNVVFYTARFKLADETFTLIPESLESSEGRYSGVIVNQETQKPLKDAKVSLDGVAAEQTTNAAGHFTITGIGTNICQTLTINSTGFAPVVKEVNIVYDGLKDCSVADKEGN